MQAALPLARRERTLRTAARAIRLRSGPARRFRVTRGERIRSQGRLPLAVVFASARSRLTAALARPPAGVAGPAAAHRGRVSATMGIRLSAAQSHLSHGG